MQPLIVDAFHINAFKIGPLFNVQQEAGEEPTAPAGLNHLHCTKVKESPHRAFYGMLALPHIERHVFSVQPLVAER